METYKKRLTLGPRRAHTSTQTTSCAKQIGAHNIGYQLQTIHSHEQIAQHSAIYIYILYVQYNFVCIHMCNLSHINALLSSI